MRVRGLGGREEAVDAVLDTGFNGFLTLPPSLISDLALPFVGTTRATLRDGSTVPDDGGLINVQANRKERLVLTLASESGVLVGMSMLFGHRVTLDVRDGGLVRIEALPQT